MSKRTSAIKRSRQQTVAHKRAAGAEQFRSALIEQAEVALALIPHEDHELLRVFLSRLIGPSRDQRRTAGYNTARLLAGMAAVSVPEEYANGQLISGELDALDTKPPAHFQTSITRLRGAHLTPAEITDEWRQAESAGRSAQLSDLTLAVCVDPRVWPYIPLMLREGPDAFVRRFVWFARAEAARGLSGASIQSSRVTYAQALVARAVELNGLGFPHPAIEEWRAKPKIPQGKTYGNKADKAQQPIPQAVVRRTMRLWWERLQLATDGGTKLPANHFRSIRLFLFTAILLTTGTRYTALAEMRIEDYEPEHIFPDQTVGPAVGLRIGKQDSDKPPLRWKALPPALVPYMSLYIEAANIQHQPRHWPFWAGSIYPPREPEDAETVPVPWHARQVLSGHKATYERCLDLRRRRVARKLLEDGASAEETERAVAETRSSAGTPVFPFPHGKNPWDGYAPHACRKYANNAIAKALTIFLETSEGEEFRGMISPSAAAASVLDHTIGPEDRYGYALAEGDQKREMWSKRLCPIVFELVVGELGAPKGIDKARVRELRHEKRELLRTEEDLHNLLTQVSRDAAKAAAVARGRMSKKAPRDINEMTPAQVVQWSHEQANALADELAAIEVRAENQRADLQRQLRALGPLMRQNEKALDQAQTTEVPLPEVEEWSWLMPGIEPDWDADSEDEAEAEGADDLMPVRNHIWPEEMRAILGKSDATMRRWLDATLLAKTKRTEGVPWTAEDLRAGRVLVVKTRRERYINTDEIDRTVLTVAQQQHLRLILAQPLPPRPRI